MALITFIGGVVLGALSSWYIAHKYYRKAGEEQKAELESLSEKLKHRNTLVDFEQCLVTERWDREQIENKDVWVCSTNNIFQITLGKPKSGFDEPWTSNFPNKSASSCLVFLRNGPAVIKELMFVYADEFRIFVPMPDVRKDESKSGNYEYFWDMTSLDVKVGRVIGSFYIHGDLPGVARMAGIQLDGAEA